MHESKDLWGAVQAHREALVDFAQRLVQTPSLPGQERAVAQVVLHEMQRLGYDKAWIDGAGNAVGYIQGDHGPSLMLNGHMDHVDAGDPALWPYPPFGAEIHDGELWGRGAVDMKGALAAMVYAGGLLRQVGAIPSGDLYVCGVVQEEVGGLGSRHLVDALPTQRVIVGEACGNQLRRGHRGRVELTARFLGRSVHASMPHLGTNPHRSLARFVLALSQLSMAQDPVFGLSTVAPTLVVSEPQSANVTPSALNLMLDWRNIPGESPEQIVAKLEGLMVRILEPPCQGRIEISSKEEVSYSGLKRAYTNVFPSFATAADHPWLREAQRVLVGLLERAVDADIWRFATDGGHFAEAGATVIGFGPGDDTVVHTVRERLPLGQLVESAVGYMGLCLIR